MDQNVAPDASRATDRNGLGSPLDVVHTGRIPCLDGLRAISILLVIGIHARMSTGFPNVGPVVRAILWRGSVGVDIFFAISGFLITTLMLREADRTGTIAIGSFYLRRALRIIPAFWAYAAFVFLLTLAGVVQVTGFQWMVALTYTTNCWGPDAVSAQILNHTWSLSTEEHFYLVWPITLLVLGRRAAIVPALVLAAEPLIRVLLRRAWGPDAMIFFTLARFDSIAAGCLLAYFSRTARAARIARSIAAHPWASTLTIAALFPLIGLLRGRIATSNAFGDTIGRPIEATAIVALIFVAICSPRSPAGRVLESRPMVGLGVLSYSLYLWQQAFLAETSPLWFTRWPINLVLTFVAGVASHVLIERPFLRVKDRIGKRRHRQVDVVVPQAEDPRADLTVA